MNVSQDARGNSENAKADLDVSDYSVSANMQRIDKPKLGFATDDQTDTDSLGYKKQTGCASAAVN